MLRPTRRHSVGMLEQPTRRITRREVQGELLDVRTGGTVTDSKTPNPLLLLGVLQNERLGC